MAMAAVSAGTEAKQMHAARKAKKIAKSAANELSDTHSATRKGTRNVISNNKRSWEPRSVSGYRRIITALFVISAIIVIYKNTKNEGWSSTQSWKRLGAVWFIYFIFGIASTTGIKVARICAALGGLITLALLLQNKELLFGATSILRGFGGTSSVDQEGATAIGSGSGTAGSAGTGSGGGGGHSWSTPLATNPLYVNGQITDRSKVTLTETFTPANAPTAATNPGGNTTTAATTVAKMKFDKNILPSFTWQNVDGLQVIGIPNADKNRYTTDVITGDFISGDKVKISDAKPGIYRDNASGWMWQVK